MSHLNQNKKILNRIRRIQGQTNALEQNILNSENSCIEVLQQVAAIKGAINGLMNEGEFKHEVRQFEKSYDNQQAEQISLMV